MARLIACHAIIIFQLTSVKCLATQLDLSIVLGGAAVGRVKMELFKTVTPKVRTRYHNYHCSSLPLYSCSFNFSCIIKCV